MLQRQVGDFVEEERAAARRLEETVAIGEGAGEGALAVTEELGLHERLGDRAAIDRDERTVLARPVRWISRATSSLPLPDSPVTCIGAWLRASRSISARVDCMRGEPPIRTGSPGTAGPSPSAPRRAAGRESLSAERTSVRN